MATDGIAPDADLAELRARLVRLEARVGRIEQERGPVDATRDDESTAPLAASPEAIPDAAADATAATLFKRVAMLVFALLGALILRVMTQQNMIDQTPGTLLGFAYAGSLVILAVIPGPLRPLARATSLLQCSGVALACMIALESALRTRTLTRPAAMAWLIAFGALGLWRGSAQRKVSLAALSALAPMLSLVALGLKAEELRWQLAGLVVLASGATALSWRPGFGRLRPLALPVVGALLAAGLFLAREQGIAAGPVLAAAAALTLVLAAQHVAALTHLGRAAAWLPAGLLWLAALAWNLAWPPLAATAAGVSALAIALVWAWQRRGASAAAGVAGAGGAAVLAGILGWPAVDSAGVLCAMAGIALWHASGREGPVWAAWGVTLMLATSAATGVLHLARGTNAVSELAAGAVLGVLLLLHYHLAGRGGKNVPRSLGARLSPVALLGGLILCLGVARGVLHRAIPDTDTCLLAQTAALGLAAIVLTFLGRRTGRRPVVYSGLACMGAALVKVAVVDLVQLKSLRLLAAVILLGGASVAISFILRRKA